MKIITSLHSSFSAALFLCQQEESSPHISTYFSQSFFSQSFLTRFLTGGATDVVESEESCSLSAKRSVSSSVLVRRHSSGCFTPPLRKNSAYSEIAFFKYCNSYSDC